MSLNNDPDGLGPDSPASDIYAPTGSRWGDGSHSKDNSSCCGRLSRYVKKKYADARGRLALMNSTFGGKFVIYVALMYGLVKGLTNQGADLSRLSYFRRMGVGVIHYAEYETVILMAWSVKPLLGTISDLVPIFGYKKKYYTAAYGLMGFGALIGCTLLPQKESYGSLAAAFYFLGALGVCGTDIHIRDDEFPTEPACSPAPSSPPRAPSSSSTVWREACSATAPTRPAPPRANSAS